MSELNKRIELEALITEREGMRADNMLTASQKRPPAHGGLDFSVLAEQIRALAEPESTPGKVCASCGGAGRRMYGNTATWHKDQEVSGQAFTLDICDRCWGSGDEANPLPNLYELVKGKKPSYTPEDVQKLVAAARNVYGFLNARGLAMGIHNALAPFKEKK
jgi:hypothetical protein